MNERKNSPQAKDAAYLLHPYTNMVAHEENGAMIIEKSNGVRIHDSEGKEYIEALAGLWCVSLGFDEERLIDAAVKQMRELPYGHLFASRSHMPAIELGERLVELFGRGMKRAFFACSGSEANDTAVKIVRYYHNALGRPSKKKIISRWRSYHGVTVAAASLTGLPLLHRDFDLPIEGVLHSECPFYYRYSVAGESESDFTDRMIESLRSLIEKEGAETIGAFIAEPVMGAGGVIIPPEGYFAKLQKLLREYEILLIADEVICGFGRLGAMFGCEIFDIEPDMVAMAKGLSSGYQPISALLLNGAVSDVVCEHSGELGSFGHGYTYSGHPVAAAVAVETLKIYEERDIVSQVQNLSGDFASMIASLGEFACVGDARCMGLLGAIDIVQDKTNRGYFDPQVGAAARLVELARKHGVLVRALFGDVVAFCPPLTITSVDIAEIGKRMRLALVEFEKELLG